MNIINFLQEHANPFLDVVAKFFDFVGGMPFFVCIIAICFLFFNKHNAYKIGVSFTATFLFSDLFMKAVIKKPRPFLNGGSLRLENYSCPAFCVGNIAGVSANIFFNYMDNDKKKTFMKTFSLSAFLIILISLVGFSNLYLGKNYLIDIIFGIAFGMIFYYIVYKFFNLKYNAWHLFLLAVPIVVSLSFYDILLEVGSFTRVFALSGLMSSFIISYFLEEEFVKYEVKNNIIFSSIKFAITLIVLVAYYLVCKFMLPKINLIVFAEYFGVGVIVFLLLPMLFKYLQRHLFVFAKGVNPMKVESSSVALTLRGTRSIARRFTNKISQGDVIVLRGELGAGKSVFVREILKSYGVRNKITSPTFTLVNEYSAYDKQFYHFDMYRLEDEEEAKNIGLEEILDKKKAVKFIEWAENIPDYLPACYKRVTIRKLGKWSRNIIVENISKGR